MKPKPDYDDLAMRYGVCQRTIYRWNKRVDITDEKALAAYLSAMKNPSTDALLALEAILTETEP